MQAFGDGIIGNDFEISHFLQRCKKEIEKGTSTEGLLSVEVCETFVSIVIDQSASRLPLPSCAGQSAQISIPGLRPLIRLAALRIRLFRSH